MQQYWHAARDKDVINVEVARDFGERRRPAGECALKLVVSVLGDQTASNVRFCNELLCRRVC
jgi:hypothetical protein